jgi:hypothetical protein
MRTSILLVVLAATLAHAADNETSRFLGAEADHAYTRLFLRSSRGMIIDQTEIALCASGSACVRHLTKEEQRFVFTIEEKDARAILALAIEKDLLGAKPKDRPGRPDEGRVEVAIENALGQTRAVSRWDSEEAPAFQAVEAALHAVAAKTTKIEPAYRGPQDPGFRPFAGVQVTVGLYSGRPDPTFELVRPEDWEKLRELTKDLAAGERLVDKEAPLGYHGFLVGPRGVAGLAKWISVFKGTVQLGDAPRSVVNKKDEKGLEDWLTVEAKKRGIETRAPR